MANINKIRISGTSYDIQDLNAPRTVELTQAEYDALVTAGTVSADTYYIITDATAVDMSNYYTTAQTQSAITEATSGLQETLVSGTNIKTINNTSILGSGNIDIQGGGSEATVSALTCYKEAILNKQYTEGEITTFYVKYTGLGGWGTTYLNFSIYNNGYEEYKMISADYNDGAFTSLTASDTAYTATIEDGDIKIVLASGCSLKMNYGTNDCTAFIYTEYSSGTTSEVMVDTVYDAICRLSDKNLTNVLKQVNVNLSDGRLYLNGVGTIANANTSVDVASSTINTNDGKLNVHFSGTTSHDAVLNNGGGNYCQLFSVYEYSKGYDDIEMAINSGYTGSDITTTFTIAFIDSSGNISSNYFFDYNITANTISTPSGYDTYGTIVDTLSTDYKVKFLSNSGYKIAAFMSSACLIGGVDTPMPNNYISNLVTTASFDYNGQEVIDDIYSKLDTKQTTLTAGTGIDITNNVISATGGGGKSVAAGRGISITTGETADTVSFNLPISAGTGSYTLLFQSGKQSSGSNAQRAVAFGQGQIKSSAHNSAAFGYSYAEAQSAFAEGSYCHAAGNASHAEGLQTTAYTQASHTEGNFTEAKNNYEHASGQYNISSSASTTWGDSGNTLFSVGNGTSTSARHNAFEIRQNGDIYLNDGSKLQDTVSATAANTTALGGLKLVKLTQSEYDALSPNYDSNTLYVIVN